MSITVDVNGFTAVEDGTHVVPTTKLGLIRWGLVSARPWWISEASLGRWTEWAAPPAGLAEFSAAELLELRRVACLLNGYLHEDALGTPVETTPHFHRLDETEADEAAARLDAAVAGQLAWSLLDVPALHHVGWTAPSLGISPGPGARRPDYAGLDADGRWIVLTAAGIAADTPAGTGSVTAVGEIDGGEVTANGAVVAVPDEGGCLDSYLEQTSSTHASGTRLDVDADRLEEARYAPFARAIASGIHTRALGVTAPLGSAATLRLFPLGVTGFIGLSEDVASLIDEALSGPVTGRRERFGAAVRQIQQARAAGATRAESPKSRPPRSRRGSTSSSAARSSTWATRSIAPRSRRAARCGSPTTGRSTRRSGPATGCSRRCAASRAPPTS